MEKTSPNPNPDSKVSTSSKKKRNIILLLGVIVALLTAGAGGYYLTSKSSNKQSDPQQNVSEDETEDQREAPEAETISLYPDGSPSTYEEHLSAIEKVKNTDNEASKIFIYYNAAVFAALSDIPEAKDYAREALNIIEQQDEANRASFEDIVPTLTAVVDGRYGDIRPR